MDYNKIQSLSQEEFAAGLAGASELTKQSDETLAKIERVLDVMSGTLSHVPQGFSNSKCECGHEITLYDFVISAMIDGNHPKSFVLHALVGSKYILGESRPVRCIACGTMSSVRHSYSMIRYRCHTDPL